MTVIPDRRDPLLLILICLIWSGNYFAIKRSLAYIDPNTLALFRVLLGGLVVLAAGRVSFAGVTKRALAWCAILGLFNSALFLVFLNRGLTTVNSGVAATLVYTQPLIVALGSPLAGEKLTKTKLFGVGAAFAGVVIVFLPSLSGSSPSGGDFYELGAAISWAISILLFKKWNTTLDGFTVTGLQSVISSIFVLPFVFLGAPFLTPNIQLWGYLGYNILLGTGLAYVIYFTVLSRMKPSQFSSYLFLVPIFTILLQSVFTLSWPSLYELVGSLLVASGILIANAFV